MSDLINRQGTIDRINEYIEEYSEIDSDGNHSEKWCAMQEAKMTIKNMPSAQSVKAYTKADYIMALHKEYGCSLARAEEAHQKALEYLRNMSMMKG